MSEPSIVLRAENPFFDIFPNGVVPVQVPQTANCELEILNAELDGPPVQACYLVDASRLTTEQMQAVAERLAELRGGRVNDVLSELIENGLPIRASEVERHPNIELRFIL
jgi:hypothetical protein